MLAADAHADGGIGLLGLGHGELHQLADALLVEHDEGVVVVEALGDVVAEELAGVVAGEGAGGLGEVVGAEGEEVNFLGDLVGGEGSAGHLDHRADEHLELDAALLLDGGDGLLDDLLLGEELLDVADEGHHDFGAGAGDVGGGLADGAHLHLGDLGVGDAEAAAAVAEHGVELVELFDQLLDFLGGDAHDLGHFGLAFLIVRDELVQGRVEQADGALAAIERLEHALEVAALKREEGGEGGIVLGEGGLELRLEGGLFGGGGGGGKGFLELLDLLGHEDHAAEGHDAVFGEEHVLGAAEADALGAEADGHLGVARGVGVGAHAHGAILVGQGHDFGEGAGELGVAGLDAALIHLAGGAVEGNPVALAEGDIAHLEGLGLGIDERVAAAGHAALAHAAGDDGGVAGHAAAGGEDALGADHAGDVFGGGLGAAEDDLLAELALGLGVLGGEDDGAGGDARGGGQAGGDDLGLLLGQGVKDGVEELVELLGLHAQHGGLLVDEAFLHKVGGDAHGGGGGALAVAGLEHVELAILDGELHVLHVLVVLLELHANGVELLEHLGHGLLERGILGGALLLGDAGALGPLAGAGDGDFLRGADAGHHVLALGVDEVFAVEVGVVAGGGVTGEGHARGGIGAGVAEDHRLHVHGGAGEAADVVQLAILDGAGVVPTAEDGLDAHLELLVGVGREVLAELGLDDLLVAGDDLLEVLGGEFGVELHALGGLDGLELVLEVVVLHAHDHVAEHLDEAAVAVHHKALVARLGDHRLHGLGVEAEVEHGVHHARHRDGGARAHGDEERVRPLAEGLARHLLKLGQRGLHLRHDLREKLCLADLVILAARLGGDGEPGRHRQTHRGHLRKVRALAAQQLLHRAVAFGRVAPEEIDILLVAHL